MNLKPYLLLIPGVGTITLLMGSALYVVIAQSFGLFSVMGETNATFEYWQTMLSDPILWRSVSYSLRTSVLGTIGAVTLAYPIALWLQKPIPGKPAIIGVLRAPMFVPGLVAAFLLMNVIAYHGIFNESLMALGVIDKPIRLANDKFGWSIVVLQIWKNLPFALILISGSIASIRGDLMDAALDLGATRWARFCQVILPLTIPALQASAILIFIGALGDFSFASVAGSRSSYSLAMLMNITATQYYEWENSAVIALVIMILAGLSAAVLTLLTQPFAKRTSVVVDMEKVS
ncbi:spermidine/putrescine ABC transporter permease [Vibrio sp. 10N.286.49.C2]|uniref:ABC transporter permease n=1 Tax=unclassified Vibrio TaxID=2614977 RepID=UPI000C854461|nr:MULTISPECIES: ABC transporter permease [unclassified Vibrio]PMH42832.1 spermidine/putrescine ABC transporter permease [Vibrio sp. 10N.286.49.C2]PMH53829.1 spermidine/putrescine ABC transporter permease [Vibrio sp. 10N.286.49.B1]PMH83109.1 spermidine/putrescine ABC transporter permease [Vibrio sp. 10N.286.48.B7]